MFCALKSRYIHCIYVNAQRIALNVNGTAVKTAGALAGKQTPPEEPEEYREGLQFLFEQNLNGLVEIFNSETPSRRGEDRVITGNAAENAFRFAQRIQQTRDQLRRTRAGMNDDDSVVVVDIQDQVLQWAGGRWHAQLSRQAVNHLHFGVAGTHCAKLCQHTGDFGLVDIIEAFFLQCLNNFALRAKFFFFQSCFKGFN